MSKYDNVTMKEYMEKKMEMLNDLGRKNDLCNGISCKDCPLSFTNNNLDTYSCSSLELLYPERALEIVMDYEPKVDWTKVPVDAKVLVKNKKDDNWYRRHFAEYKDGDIYTYVEGLSSFTADDGDIIRTVSWKYGKLYKEGE